MARPQSANAQRVVVLGASAGGVETLSTVVGGLPDGLPAAVLVVLHVPSWGTSVLPDILARRGPLPAHHAVDGEPLLPGVVYVAPPDQHLLVEQGAVRLGHGPKENGTRPAVDALFRSAACAFGEDVIAVVLSGTLNDGTAGLIAVNRHGGITIAQDPDDARFPSMPENAVRFARPTHVLPASAIAGVVADHILGERRPTTGGEPPGRAIMQDSRSADPAAHAAERR